MQTYHRRVADRMWQRRLAGALFVAFAGLALVLAVVGLYGVLSFIVVQQTREIGMRVALGATPRDVARLVVGRGLRLAATGLALGIVAALALAQVMRTVLFGIGSADAVTFVVAPLMLLLVAGLAAYVPARRALRIDPITALRSE